MQTSTFTSATVFEPLGVDNAWNLEAFKAGLQIKVQPPPSLLAACAAAT